MTFCYCDECGLRLSKKLQKQLRGHVCPRCDCMDWYEEEVPKSEVTLVDEVIDDQWTAIAKDKGLL